MLKHITNSTQTKDKTKNYTPNYTLVFVTCELNKADIVQCEPVCEYIVGEISHSTADLSDV